MVPMIRFTCGTILLLITMFRLSGAIENAWVAGFKDNLFQSSHSEHL